MVDNLINTSFPALLLFTVFAFSVFVQLIYLWLVFNKVGLKRNLILPDERRGNPEPVSVVICAHNEFLHLRDNLPSILHQDYPEYEVLVVNHFSDDDTPYLLRKLQEQYPHLHVVTIEEELNFFTGKKFPLSIGIKSARYDRILLTDADCRPVSDQWIRWMSSGFDQRKEIVLGYGRYRYNKGLLNALIRFDTLHIALQYLGFALAGRPYMGTAGFYGLASRVVLDARLQAPGVTAGAVSGLERQTNPLGGAAGAGGHEQRARFAQALDRQLDCMHAIAGRRGDGDGNRAG